MQAPSACTDYILYIKFAHQKTFIQLPNPFWIQVQAKHLAKKRLEALWNSLPDEGA